MLESVVNLRIKRRYNWIVTGKKWKLSKEFKDDYNKFLDHIISLGVDNKENKYIHLIDSSKDCIAGNIQLLSYPLRPHIVPISYGETKEEKESRLFSMFDKLQNTLNPIGGLLVDVCNEWKGPTGYPVFKKWAIEKGYNDSLFIEWNGKDIINPDTVMMTKKRKKISYDIEYDGKVYSMGELANKYALTYKTLVYRLRKGRTMEQALGLKHYQRDISRGQFTVMFRGEVRNLAELVEIYRMNYNIVYWRALKLGWTIEEALEIKERSKTRKRSDMIGRKFNTMYGDKLIVLGKATKKGVKNPMYNCRFLTGPDVETEIKRAPNNIVSGKVRNRFRITTGKVGVLGETEERDECSKEVAKKLLILWTDAVGRVKPRLCSEWNRYSKFHNFVIRNLDLNKFVDSNYMLDHRLLDAFSKHPANVLTMKNSYLIPSCISSYLNRSPFCTNTPIMKYKDGYRVMFTTKRRKSGSIRLSLGVYSNKIEALAVQFEAHSRYIRELISFHLNNKELPEEMILYNWKELYHVNKTLDKKIKQYLVDNPLSRELNNRIDDLVLASIADRLEIEKDKVGL